MQQRQLQCDESYCQSINAKFDELQVFINRINKFNPIGAICLQETWTSESDDISLYEIANYNVFHLGKLCCNHGSLFINVHNIFKQNLHNLTLVVRIGKRTV